MLFPYTKNNRMIDYMLLQTMTAFYSSLVPIKKLVWLSILLNLGCLQGCVSPMMLGDTVISYDKAVTDTLTRQLLLNIGRAHQHQPIHFTGVANIAETLSFGFNAGATTATTGENGGLITPIFGGSVSESPTISIIPMESEEFTQRLLIPIQEPKLAMLLRQTADIDVILRLLIDELSIMSNTHIEKNFPVSDNHMEKIYRNKPSDANGYRFFRQAVLHMSSIEDRQGLFIEPLIFEKTWTLPAESLSADQMADLQKEFKVDYDIVHHQVKLTKHIVGHIIMTNFDTTTLSNEEREALNEEADILPDNEIHFYIRPGYIGGEWPLHGTLRLRSFQNVLNFVGQSISDDPEYFVPKHPLTPGVPDNPSQTLAIVVSHTMPITDEPSVKLGDYYYTINPENDGYEWNHESLRLLYQVFQMSMTNLPRSGVPTITISK